MAAYNESPSFDPVSALAERGIKVKQLATAPLSNDDVSSKNYAATVSRSVPFPIARTSTFNVP